MKFIVTTTLCPSFLPLLYPPSVENEQKSKDLVLVSTVVETLSCLRICTQNKQDVLPKFLTLQCMLKPLLYIFNDKHQGKLYIYILVPSNLEMGRCTVYNQSLIIDFG